MARTKLGGFIIVDSFNLIYNAALIYLSLFLSFKLISLTLVEITAFKVVCILILSLILLTLIPSLIMFMLPRIKPGQYAFPNHPMSLLWTLKFYIKKPLTLKLVSNFIFTYHFYSYFILKLQKCRITPWFQFAANIELRDPEFTIIGEHVTIGSDTILCPHRMVKNKIELGPIVIGENSSIGAFGLIGPNVTIGSNTIIGTKVNIQPGVKIGNNVIIKNGVIIDPGAIIEDHVILKNHVHIKKLQVVAANSVVDDEK